MNTKLKTLIAFSTAFVTYLLYKKAQHDTIARFPNIDRKVRVKAYNRLMMDALAQRTPDNASVEDLDELFLAHVRTIDPWAKTN